MITKKDLERQFEVSDNTVYKTLKACGLNTSKEEYTQEEIENCFKVARDMIGAGKRYKDIERYFGLTSADPEQTEQYQTNQSTASDALGTATAELAVDMVQGAVKQISPYIPQLIAHTLAQEMRSPQMKNAFEDMRSQIVQKNNNVRNVGVDFLLDKMNHNNRVNQLTGSSNPQQQLPQASEENFKK